ncbi:PIR protein [Plasmodium sp. DRC-Itaito]|nr:PIR protein [Plasmodium sp. DRC-Itaito]
MKLHCSKILLLFLPLNILVTSYEEHNNNEPHITPRHIPTYTSRVLSECDTQSSNYDKDAEMKSVKENFDGQTTQRFKEYKERMKNKRQKRKEQRDKNVQKIIEEDKREKSLEEKIEKGCLKCGCALGGVAASVGVFGGLGVYGSKTAALATAREAAMVEGLAAGEAARIPAGIKAVIEGITKEFDILTLGDQALGSYITQNTYTNVTNITRAVYMQYEKSSCLPTFSGPVVGSRETICALVWEKSAAARKISGNAVSHNAVIKKTVESIVSNAETVAETAAKKATEELIKTSTDAVESTYASCQTAIIASVVAVLVIALVMIIIYLVLRYRRKKKMNKKAQYTKLLNQ